MIKIVLADDHPVVREGLRSLLESAGDCQVVGQVSDGLEALQAVERLQPDVAVVDIMMPLLSGLEVARQVRERHLPTAVVVLTMHADEAYVQEALHSGAIGYVLKDSCTPDLVRAVREASCGRRFLSAPIVERAVDCYVRVSSKGFLDPLEALTVREREVLHLMAHGLTTAEVAVKLCISGRTVESHRARLMRKLGLRNQTDLVKYAMRKGLMRE